VTSDQAATVIDQQAKLLELYAQLLPLFQTFVHDVFPLVAVVAAWAVGAFLARSAT
jgi:hypothetical protein